MRIRNTRDLGLLLRHGRRDRGWSQQVLAEKIGASRHWVIGVERGKPTAEIGLVLKALSVLGLTCDIRKSGPAGLQRWSDVAKHLTAPDLNFVLVRARGGRISWPKKGHMGMTPALNPAIRDVPVPDLERVLRDTTGKRIGFARPGKAAEKRTRSTSR